jgi:hypothetical protein
MEAEKALAKPLTPGFDVDKEVEGDEYMGLGNAKLRN